MNIQQIEYLVAVATHNSFTKAAASLFIPQQTVSRSICMLEEELGIKLFIRSDQGVFLSNAGKLIFPLAESLLEKYNWHIKTIQEIADNEKSQLNISFENNILSQATPASLMSRIGNIRITSTHCRSCNQCIQNVKSKNSDLAFVFKPKDTEGLEYISILKRPLIIIMNKNNPLASKESLTIYDLKNEVHVWDTSVSASVLTNYQKACINAGFYPRIGYELPDMDMRFKAVAEGLGISPGGNILMSTFEDQLVRIPLIHPDVVFDIGFLALPGYQEKKELISYINAMKAVFS